MIAFWIAAALLASATAGLVLLRARRAEAHAGVTENPSLNVYRRQLGELDDLSAHGLLPAGEYRSARAEAARRLLAAADDRSEAAAPARFSPKLGRWLALAGAGLAPLLALGVYLHVGAPGLADRPFAKRLAEWRAADPRTLDPMQMAALLTQVAAERPGDPQPLYYLARAELGAGDAYSAERALRKAITLAPGRADLWTALGFTLAADGGGRLSDEALKAFRQANLLDPKAPDPRYFLARARISSGDVQGGLNDWRALEADLPPTDPRKAALREEIAAVETGAVRGAVAAPAPAQPVADAAFIQSMVDGLAARLQAQPDDPAGWGRLIHAYGVLGEQDKQKAAVTRAESVFKGRADALATIAAAAQAPR